MYVRSTKLFTASDQIINHTKSSPSAISRYVPCGTAFDTSLHEPALCAKKTRAICTIVSPLPGRQVRYFLCFTVTSKSQEPPPLPNSLKQQTAPPPLPLKFLIAHCSTLLSLTQMVLLPYRLNQDFQWLHLSFRQQTKFRAEEHEVFETGI